MFAVISTANVKSAYSTEVNLDFIYECWHIVICIWNESTWYTSRSLSLEAPTTTHASSSPDGSSAIVPSARNTLTHIINIRPVKMYYIYDNKERKGLDGAIRFLKNDSQTRPWLASHKQSKQKSAPVIIWDK